MATQKKRSYTSQYEVDHHNNADRRDKTSVGHYLATRWLSLRPPMDRLENPITLLRLLNFRHWQFFLVAFFGWTWDAFDFHTVSFTVPSLAATFNKTNAEITWGITLVLMTRSVGALLFGLAADRYGRKWPFVVNNILFILLELLTGFCQNFTQFLVCRAFFGVAMGGLWGNAAATALEDCPPRARGILSGMLQQGYVLGYLVAAVFARVLVNTTPHGWRPLMWFGACPPVLIIAFRLCLPETDSFIEREKVRAAGGQSIGRTFVAQGRVVVKRHWKLLIYLVLFMAAFNFMSHGSQDLYPTMLSNQYNFTPNQVTITQVVANLGAIVGGTTVGYSSQMFGRRFSIIVVCIIGGALLYPYGFVGSTSVAAAAFFEQFCVQGAFGVIPVHLIELAPGNYRTLVAGLTYQLGNLLSSASATIEATVGERFPLPPKIVHGKNISRYQYGTVMAIFLGCVFVVVILLTFLGPENKDRNLGFSYDHDVKEIVGDEAVERDYNNDHDPAPHPRYGSGEDVADKV